VSVHYGPPSTRHHAEFVSDRISRPSLTQVPVKFLMRNPSAGLLLVQLLGIVLYPLMESSPRGRTLFGMFGLLVLGLALWVVRSGPWLTWLGLTLALPVVLLSAVNVFVPRTELMVTAAALETIFYFYAAGSLIAYMLQDWHVHVDELFAAGATFTLLAWGFAYAFVVCQALVPGTFGHAAGIPGQRTWLELLYLSVAVLSSVGLSDIYPVKPMGRSLVMLESIIGIMYIALVVSRLIGMSTYRRKDDTS
jgi:Ion channel